MAPENALVSEGASSSSGSSSTVTAMESYIASRLSPSGEVHEWLILPPITLITPVLIISPLTLSISQPS